MMARMHEGWGGSVWGLPCEEEHYADVSPLRFHWRSGKADGLMAEIPTIVVDPLPPDVPDGVCKLPWYSTVHELAYCNDTACAITALNKFESAVLELEKETNERVGFKILLILCRAMWCCTGRGGWCSGCASMRSGCR